MLKQRDCSLEPQVLPLPAFALALAFLTPAGAVHLDRRHGVRRRCLPVLRLMRTKRTWEESLSGKRRSCFRCVSRVKSLSRRY